ncbi:uncharacterized protein LOC144664193 [Oculina patagonica]
MRGLPFEVAGVAFKLKSPIARVNVFLSDRAKEVVEVRQACLKESLCVSNQKDCIYGISFDLSVIICYAPIEDAEEAQKDVFYDQLQQAVQEVPSHDVLCVIGDFNAHVGNDNEGREKIMGKNGCGNINDNGRRLCDLKGKNSLLDVKARRGADVENDHQLLMATLAIKLRKTKRGKVSATRIDAAKLKVPEIMTAFQLELRNRFEALEEEPGEHNLSNFHQTMREAGEAILGIRRRKKEEWRQQGTWDKINERKQMKEKINSTRSERVKDRCRKKYQELDKEVKRMAKRGKKDYVENLAEEAEEAAARQDLKTLYTISKTLRGGYRSGNRPGKDKNGRVLSRVDDNLKR